jgi:hypothetical protein
MVTVGTPSRRDASGRARDPWPKLTAAPDPAHDARQVPGAAERTLDLAAHPLAVLGADLEVAEAVQLEQLAGLGAVPGREDHFVAASGELSDQRIHDEDVRAVVGVEPDLHGFSSERATGEYRRLSVPTSTPLPISCDKADRKKTVHKSRRCELLGPWLGQLLQEELSHHRQCKRAGHIPFTNHDESAEAS